MAIPKAVKSLSNQIDNKLIEYFSLNTTSGRLRDDNLPFSVLLPTDSYKQFVNYIKELCAAHGIDDESYDTITWRGVQADYILKDGSCDSIVIKEFL